jgi:prepilin-type N-terminal cleavage/methylation domain-containing protein
MRQHRRSRASQNGFTLMEITISVVLLGILGVVGTTMMSGSFYTTRVISTEHLAYSEARYAMERMAREIREMQYDTATSSLSLSTMTAAQLSFVKTSMTGTSNVSFQYTAPTLSMSYPPAASAVLARDISAFSFTYLDENRVVTAQPNSVRFVRIALTTSPSGAQALSLVTQVNLRNP